MHITGKCHCGAISFTATVDPKRVLVCHCADCQTMSGAPFRAVLPTPVGDVVMTGAAKHYVKVAESGNRRVQAFCPECGTQLYATEADGEPKVMNLRLGCVDQRDQLVPVAQLWGESAMPWLAALKDVPLHGKGLASPVMKTPGADGVPSAATAQTSSHTSSQTSPRTSS
ncbi:GFA family protein [Leptothrix sp. BB-4]